jgi:ferredoxin-NADP reductase/DMSO/TMAO reductase YedYZ heme-binding membrane subunit
MMMALFEAGIRSGRSYQLSEIKFYRALALLNGIIPLCMLCWDAWYHRLGANSVNHAIHTTGSMCLIFLMLTLMVTPIQKIFGWHTISTVRRILGLYAFFYGLIHLGIFFTLDRAASLSSTWHEMTTRVYLQIGALALILMVPLAVTSTSGMIRRMGFDNWKLLHRLTYLVAILGVIHFFLLVKANVEEPLMYGGFLAGLLGFRWFNSIFSGTPARTIKKPAKARVASPWSGQLKVMRIQSETHNVKTFQLAMPNGEGFPFPFKPGQYLTVRMNIDQKNVGRSYTIASSPLDQGYCELTIKREPEGTGSRHMHDQIQVGDLLDIIGPSGRFVFTGEELTPDLLNVPPAEQGVLMVAGGVGITPLMSMLRTLLRNNWPGQIYLLFVAKTEADIIFEQELMQLSNQHAQFHLHIFLTRTMENSPWKGLRGRLQIESIKQCCPDVAMYPAFVCGPDAMMAETCNLLKIIGVPAAHIQTEAFTSPGAFTETIPEHDLPVGAAVISSTKSSGGNSTGAFEVSFSKSGQVTTCAEDMTVLEAGEELGLDLPFECRSGVCGSCKLRLMQGEVKMLVEDALHPAEKAKGYFLACQAHPLSDVAVDF